MAFLAIPIMLLNFFSGIVGAVWLGVEGEWALIGIGVAIAIGGTLFASLLMLPGMILAFPAIAAVERGNKIIAGFFGALSVIYTYFIMAIWAIIIFLAFIKKSDVVIPTLLWSYATATITWSYMAQKEANINEYSGISAFFHQIGCIAIMIYAYNNFNYPNWQEMSVWYLVPVLFGAAFSIFLVLANSSQGNR